MTEKEFLALPSDKRDALIAEHALLWRTKWTEVKHRRRPTGDFRLWVKSDEGRWWKCPAFTLTWVDDFWSVVKRLKNERNVFVNIHPFGDFYEIVIHNSGGNEMARARHQDVQLAIAVAVGKAFGFIKETPHV